MSYQPPQASSQPHEALGEVQTAAIPDPRVSFWSDQIMVAVDSASELRDLARDLQVDVLRDQGRSGYGLLQVPEDRREAVLSALKSDPRVAGIAPSGRMVGAQDSTSTPDYSTHQWHLDAAVDSLHWNNMHLATVAVLDTGVAYEDHSDSSHTYIQAHSLASTSFVHPWDFVNNDAHPNDDHQHGTHITSLIASQGSVLGMARGVQIMPVKVLDENNEGVELDLIEALYWAADNGADVINLSLAFGADYTPSAALRRALQHADDVGVVVVAAAGNDGRNRLAFPARSPSVIAVAASCVDNGELIMAPYSNLSKGVDIVAPGGCMDRDADGDGYVDGMLAETIALNQPGQMGHWYIAGTSQATALVSAAVGHMMTKGIAPAEARFLMQHAALDSSFSEVLAKGLDVYESRWDAKFETTTYDWDYHAALMPYLADVGGGQVAPALWVSILDRNGQPASNVTVHGRIDGASQQDFSCYLDPGARGECTVLGDPVADTTARGEPASLAWSVVVDSVQDHGHHDTIYNVTPMIFASDQLDVLADPDSEVGSMLVDALLAFYWDDTDDPDLGPVAPSYVVVNSGTGITTSPMGFLFSKETLEGLGDVKLEQVDGTGISTSPFGIRKIGLDGSGISTSPFGLRNINLVAMDGAGISTSPFGMKSMLNLSSSENLAGNGAIYHGEPVFLREATVSGASTTNTALQDMLDSGGMVTLDGVSGADILGWASEAAELEPPTGMSTALGAVPLEE